MLLNQQVQQAINKNYKGHTVVVVAHRLSTIENADKIIVLNNGQIVEQGTHKELLRKQGLYAYLVNKQTHNSEDDSISQSGTSTPVIQPVQSLSYNINLDDKMSKRLDKEFWLDFLALKHFSSSFKFLKSHDSELIVCCFDFEICLNFLRREK